MKRSLILVNVCGNKATERMCVSKQANGCRDSTQHLESTILNQIRSMRISSSMTLETWGIPGCGTAPRWPPDIRIWPARRFGRQVEREEEILRRGILFTAWYYDLYCSSSARPGLLNLNATLQEKYFFQTWATNNEQTQMRITWTWLFVSLHISVRSHSHLLVKINLY